MNKYLPTQRHIFRREVCLLAGVTIDFDEMNQTVYEESYHGVTSKSEKQGKYLRLANNAAVTPMRRIPIMSYET